MLGEQADEEVDPAEVPVGQAGQPGPDFRFGWRSRFLRARSSRIVVRGSAWRAAIWEGGAISELTVPLRRRHLAICTDEDTIGLIRRSVELLTDTAPSGWAPARADTEDPGETGE